MGRHKACPNGARRWAGTGPAPTDMAMFVKKVICFLSLTVALLGCALWAEGGREASLAQSSGQNEEDWLYQAKQAERGRNLPRAAECYVNYLKAHPQDAEVYQRLGLIYYLSDHFQDAVPALQQALKLDSSRWGSALFLGICYYRVGQFAKALEPLHYALQIKPDLPEGYFWLGTLLHALGRNEEAIAELQKVPRGSSVSLEADSLLVKTYRETADSYYNRIEKVSRHSYRVFQLEADALAWKGRDLEAIEEYRQALAIEPRLEGVHRAIGDLYSQKSEFELARKEYEAEIQLTPLDEESHLKLGQYWLAKRDIDRAATHLELAARVNKNSWEAHRDLAQVWLARGDDVKAESLLKTAVQLNPDDPLVHRILAELYQRTNRPDLAGREPDLYHKLSSVSGKEMESGAGETGKSDSPPEH